jgi:hypothetical protein
MSKTTRAEAFVSGARIAYEDCAALADGLAENASGFQAHVASGDGAFQPHLVAAVEIASKAILSTLADIIRDKGAELDRRFSAASASPKTSGERQ